MDINEFCYKLIKNANTNGIKYTEVYGKTSISLELKNTNQKTDKIENCTYNRLTFSGYYNNKKGYGYTEVFDENSIDKLISDIKNNSIITDEVLNIDLMKLDTATQNYKTIKKFHGKLESISFSENLKIMEDMESLILMSRDNIESYSCHILHEREIIVFRNYAGVNIKEQKNLYIAICELESFINGCLFKKISVEGFKDINRFSLKKFVYKAMQDIKHQFLSDIIPTGKIPIIFSNYAMSGLLSIFGKIFYANNNLIYKQLGKSIFSTLISITEDPHNGLNSNLFDAEGILTKRIQIVKNGVLLNLIHSAETAKILNTESTGNMIFSETGEANIGSRGMHIESGIINFHKMLNLMKTGLIITELVDPYSGSDIISGDFSLLCNGINIVNHKNTGIVEGVIVSGNFYTVLKNIVELSNDICFYVEWGFAGSPSIYAGNLIVSG